MESTLLPKEWSAFVDSLLQTYLKGQATEPGITRRITAHIRKSAPPDYADAVLREFKKRKLQVDKGIKKLKPKAKKLDATTVVSTPSTSSTATTLSATATTTEAVTAVSASASAHVKPRKIKKRATPPPQTATEPQEVDDEEEDPVLDFDALDDDATAADEIDVDSGEEDVDDEANKAFAAKLISEDELLAIRMREQESRRRKVKWNLSTGESDDEEDVMFERRVRLTQELLEKKKTTLHTVDATLALHTQGLEVLSAQSLKEYASWRKRLLQEIKDRESELRV
jgi:hypothetical protein